MESLTEKVYECTLAVEAHMVCDLLSQAGISACVDGEFMQSAMGEIPVGNAVKVRVDPARAAEAREVIADWEQLQPVDPIAVPVTKSWRFTSPLWFVIGAMAGAAGMFIGLRNPASSDGIDYDGDGRLDVTYRYAGSQISRTTIDRNGDGKTDARWIFGLRGFEERFEADDDFDERFEWSGDVDRGQVTRSVLDADGDGRPDQVWQWESGVLSQIDYYFASGGRIVKREFYLEGLLDAAEFDVDGDGVFERRVRYDRFREPVL